MAAALNETENYEHFDVSNLINDPELFDAYLEEMIRTELRKPIVKNIKSEYDADFHCECCESDYLESEEENESDSGVDMK